MSAISCVPGAFGTLLHVNDSEYGSSSPSRPEVVTQTPEENTQFYNVLNRDEDVVHSEVSKAAHSLACLSLTPCTPYKSRCKHSFWTNVGVVRAAGRRRIQP